MDSWRTAKCARFSLTATPARESCVRSTQCPELCRQYDRNHRSLPLPAADARHNNNIGEAVRTIELSLIDTLLVVLFVGRTLIENATPSS